jgi:hypothetical protein
MSWMSGVFAVLLGCMLFLGIQCRQTKVWFAIALLLALGFSFTGGSPPTIAGVSRCFLPLAMAGLIRDRPGFLVAVSALWAVSGPALYWVVASELVEVVTAGLCAVVADRWLSARSQPRIRFLFYLPCAIIMLPSTWIPPASDLALVAIAAPVLALLTSGVGDSLLKEPR